MSAMNGFPLEAGWRPLLKDLGIRHADLLRRAGLPGDLLVRLPTTLNADAWFRLWQALEYEVASDKFPLELIHASSTESMSPPVFAALCSPDLWTAAKRLSDYKRLIAPVRLDVEMEADGLNLTFHWLKPPQSIPSSMITFEFLYVTMLARVATREELKPHYVSSTVLPENTAAFETFLGVPIKSGRTNSMRFSRKDAVRPFLTASDAMWQTFEPALKQRLSDLSENAPLGDRVKSVLLEGLPSGRTSIEETVGALAMSKRTLQRRLELEGTNFSSVLKETREKLALHYLKKTRITTLEICFLLGFSEPSSFYRAFHEWTGSTPEVTRSEYNG